MSASVSN